MARGLPPPDWHANPPRTPADLPADPAALTGGGRVNANFWDPRGAIGLYLDEAERICRALGELPPDLPDGLDRAAAKARTTLGELPALRREFS